MRRLLLAATLILLAFAGRAPEARQRSAFQTVFFQNADSLDAIEGIWNVSTTQEFYRYDTLYDIQTFAKAARVAIMKKEGKYDSYNLTGESYDVEFQTTDVKGVYLYRNFFRETNEYSKTQAVISKPAKWSTPTISRTTTSA